MSSAVCNFLGKCLRIFLEIVSSIIFGLKYWGVKRTPLPPISNKLVTEPATSLAYKIRSKKVTSEEVIQAFIDRIHDVNPILNAVVQDRFEEALDEAKEVDQYIRSTDKSLEELAKEKPFLGVPFTVKDYIGVKGLKQTCGLWARRERVAEEDADCVRLMKEAGAIVLAITNVPEFCMWWESCNTIYGRTNNPYDVTRIPGGSSGGEGSLQSACGTPLSIGTDIGGSIRLPAFFNGVFGHKPTSGVVSNKGEEPDMIGLHDYFSVTGPLCKYAGDALAMYKVLAGENAKLLSLDTQVNLKDLKIYYMETEGGNPIITPVDEEITKAQRKVLQYLKEEFGVTPVKVNIKYFVDSRKIFFAKLMAEKNAHPYTYEFGNREEHVCVWTESIKWLFGKSKHAWPALYLMFNAKLLKNIDSQKYLDEYDELEKEMKELLGTDGVFLFPTQPKNDIYHNGTFFCGFDFVYTGIVNVLSMPATHMPLGLGSNGLPLGIQVVANQHQDHLCLAVAQEIEKGFGGWVNPSKVL